MSWCLTAMARFAQAASYFFPNHVACHVDSFKSDAMTSDRQQSVHNGFRDGNGCLFSRIAFQRSLAGPWGATPSLSGNEIESSIGWAGVVSPFFLCQWIGREMENAWESFSDDRKIWPDGRCAKAVPAGNYSNLIVTDKLMYFHEIGPGMGGILCWRAAASD